MGKHEQVELLNVLTVQKAARKVPAICNSTETGK